MPVHRDMLRYVFLCLDFGRVFHRQIRLDDAYAGSSNVACSTDGSQRTLSEFHHFSPVVYHFLHPRNVIGRLVLARPSPSQQSPCR
jgi:hypothetical protein